jgi:hypothetical protein
VPLLVIGAIGAGDQEATAWRLSLRACISRRTMRDSGARVIVSNRTQRKQRAWGLVSEDAMAIRGIITGKDVVAHARLIAREFGIGALWRCHLDRLRRPTTFLACVLSARL